MCVCKCIVIDRSCVVENSPLTYHINEDEVLHAVKEMQNLHLKELFGTCYDTMCTQINANGGLEGLDAKWLTLLEEAEPAMAWFAYHEWLDLYGASKAYAHGERAKNSPNSESIEKNEFDEKKGEAIGRAETYASLVRKFIKDNATTYDCYDDDKDCLCDELTEDYTNRIEVI